jgi:hypothetical protein
MIPGEFLEWNGQAHCAHLWTVIFAVWDWEYWWWIDYKPQNEMQKTPGLYQSKETIVPFTSSNSFHMFYLLFVEVDSLSTL